MATADFLKLFPAREAPCVYTGLFRKRTFERAWSDRPNRGTQGVSYTLYSEAMDMSCDGDMSLFDLFHGNCVDFALFLKEKHPEWQVECIRRGTFWNPVVHAFCMFEKDGVTCYADARGITDDAEEFFSDFSGGKTMYREDPKKTEKYARDGLFCREACETAYEMIFRAGNEKQRRLRDTVPGRRAYPAKRKRRMTW